MMSNELIFVCVWNTPISVLQSLMNQMCSLNVMAIYERYETT